LTWCGIEGWVVPLYIAHFRWSNVHHWKEPFGLFSVGYIKPLSVVIFKAFFFGGVFSRHIVRIREKGVPSASLNVSYCIRGIADVISLIAHSTVSAIFLKAQVE
jgi:hypothetical protein